MSPPLAVRWQLAALATIAVAFGVFVRLALQVRDHDPPWWDHRLLRFLSPARQSHLTGSALNGLADIVGNYQSLVLAGALLAALLALRRPRAALLFGTVLAASLATVTILKPHFERPPLLDDNEGYFPSSHAAGALTAGVAVTAAVWRTRARWPVLVTGLALVTLYGAALVYTRNHYPSDVVAGWCITLAWSCAYVVLEAAGSRFQHRLRSP